MERAVLRVQDPAYHNLVLHPVIESCETLSQDSLGHSQNKRARGIGELGSLVERLLVCRQHHHGEQYMCYASLRHS